MGLWCSSLVEHVLGMSMGSPQKVKGSKEQREKRRERGREKGREDGSTRIILTMDLLKTNVI